ncbi:hypothetical protein [Taibaiella chishuiensis]|uniref:DKNYY family protein n=1 Tax=Taibaiella chishuiensis TaxID=1434707 RepID=A0A2P8CV90_9BACT|nr:hypothetical protein [Taibaiella chishuiensis]PSK88894.1 hypothetical protein B0I18_114106 [Taibaiella chishuiensis]
MRKKLHLGLLLTMLVAGGCRKAGTDISDPDPCTGQMNINAGFSITEELVYTETDAAGNYIHQYEYAETDTVYAANTVVFSALTPYCDSLKWYIGAEVLPDRKVRRRSFPENQYTTIRLVVYYKSYAACMPGHRWTDTVEKSFYTVGTLEDIPVSGVYEGYNTDKPDQLFTIQVNDTSANYRGAILDRYGRTGCIQEFPRGNTDEDWNKYNGIAWGGKHFFIGHFNDIDTAVTRNYFGMYGTGALHDGILTIEYRYEDNGYQHFLTGVGRPGLQYVSKTFIGKKIRSY